MMNARSLRFFTLLIFLPIVCLFLSAPLFAAAFPPDISTIHGKDERLQVTFLDVGQGDSILIRTREKTVLIDAGSDVDHSAEDIIIPFLEAAGIKKIDTAVITHAHRDHFGGFLTLVEAVPIGEFVYSTGVATVSRFDPETTKGDDILYKRLFSQIRAKNIPVRKAKISDTYDWGSQVHVDILHADHPHPAPAPGQPALTANDTSLVFKVTCGKIGYLFTGDATALVEREMIRERPGCFPCNILKVGHHGSRTSSSNAFLDVMKPDHGVFSVGISNSYNHPASDILQRYASRDIRILRTDQDGTIESATDGATVTFGSTQRGRGLRNILCNLGASESVYGPDVAANRYEAVNDLVLTSMKRFILQNRHDEIGDIFSNNSESYMQRARYSMREFLGFRQIHGEAGEAERELASSMNAAVEGQGSYSSTSHQ